MNKNLETDFDVVISSKTEIKEFDFASYELNDVEIATVSEQEKIFMNSKCRNYGNIQFLPRPKGYLLGTHPI